MIIPVDVFIDVVKSERLWGIVVVVFTKKGSFSNVCSFDKWDCGGVTPFDDMLTIPSFSILLLTLLAEPLLTALAGDEREFGLWVCRADRPGNEVLDDS